MFLHNYLLVTFICLVVSAITLSLYRLYFKSKFKMHNNKKLNKENYDYKSFVSSVKEHGAFLGSYFYKLVLFKVKQENVYHLNNFLYVLDKEDYRSDKSKEKRKFLLSTLDKPIVLNNTYINERKYKKYNLNFWAIAMFSLLFVLAISLFTPVIISLQRDLLVSSVDGTIFSIISILVSFLMFIMWIPLIRYDCARDLFDKYDVRKSLYSSKYIGDEVHEDYYDTLSLINFLSDFKTNQKLNGRDYPLELDNTIKNLHRLAVKDGVVNQNSLNKIKDNIIDILFYYYLSEDDSVELLNDKFKEVNEYLTILIEYQDNKEGLNYDTLLELHNMKKAEYKNKMMNVQ